MSQSPTQPPYAQFGSEYDQAGPARTSGLAISSLVIAIASIVPLFCIFLGSGALAMMLGGAALMFISRERGRLGGRGIAFAGIITGLFVTVVQIVAIAVIIKSVGFFQKQLVGPVDQAIRAIDRGDYTSARKLFTPEADAKITDLMLTDFAARCRSEFGAYQGPPDSLWDLAMGWARAGDAMDQLGPNAGNTFPFPVRFANTDAVVVVLYDSARFDQSRGPSFAFPTINLGVLSPDNRSVWITEDRPPPGMGQFRFTPPKAPASPTPPVVPERSAGPTPAEPSAAPAKAEPRAGTPGGG